MRVAFHRLEEFIVGVHGGRHSLQPILLTLDEAGGSVSHASIV
jgi:hypothetical protein